MANFFKEISSKLTTFIEKQNIYFVGTAVEEGRVNISPKGMDSFRVIGPNKVMWLNLTGSGNETAIHLDLNGRMTIMFCSFNKNPLILRLYGQAKSYHRGEAYFEENISEFKDIDGARQIIEMVVDLVQTSCGYAVPKMDFVTERDTLRLSLEKKEKAGMDKYWNEKNALSIDGLKSSVFKKEGID